MQTGTAWPMQRMTSRTMQDKPRTATVTAMETTPTYQAVTPSPTTPRSGRTVTATATVTRPTAQMETPSQTMRISGKTLTAMVWATTKTIQTATLSQRIRPNGRIVIGTASAIQQTASARTIALMQTDSRRTIDVAVQTRTWTAGPIQTPIGWWPKVQMPSRRIEPSGRTLTETGTATIQTARRRMLA